MRALKMLMRAAWCFVVAVARAIRAFFRGPSRDWDYQEERVNATGDKLSKSVKIAVVRRQGAKVLRIAGDDAAAITPKIVETMDQIAGGAPDRNHEITTDALFSRLEPAISTAALSSGMRFGSIWYEGIGEEIVTFGATFRNLRTMISKAAFRWKSNDMKYSFDRTVVVSSLESMKVQYGWDPLVMICATLVQYEVTIRYQTTHLKKDPRKWKVAAQLDAVGLSTWREIMSFQWPVPEKGVMAVTTSATYAFMIYWAEHLCARLEKAGNREEEKAVIALGAWTTDLRQSMGLPRDPEMVDPNLLVGPVRISSDEIEGHLEVLRLSMTARVHGRDEIPPEVTRSKVTEAAELVESMFAHWHGGSEAYMIVGAATCNGEDHSGYDVTLAGRQVAIEVVPIRDAHEKEQMCGISFACVACRNAASARVGRIGKFSTNGEDETVSGLDDIFVARCGVAVDDASSARDLHRMAIAAFSYPTEFSFVVRKVGILTPRVASDEDSRGMKSGLIFGKKSWDRYGEDACATLNALLTAKAMGYKPKMQSVLGLSARKYAKRAIPGPYVWSSLLNSIVPNNNTVLVRAWKAPAGVGWTIIMGLMVPGELRWSEGRGSSVVDDGLAIEYAILGCADNIVADTSNAVERAASSMLGKEGRSRLCQGTEKAGSILSTDYVAIEGHYVVIDKTMVADCLTEIGLTSGELSLGLCAIATSVDMILRIAIFEE